MSEMRQGLDGGGEQPPGGTSTQEAPWLEDLTVYNQEGDLWARAPRWRLQAHPDVTLVAIPLLYLSQRATYQLIHVRSYPDVFRDCRFSAIGLNLLSFQIFGAEFPFYRTGRPELVNVLTTLEGGSADIAKIIRLGVALLT